MNRKLFIFDLDGTILTTENNYLQSSFDALTKIKEQGHFIAIASGRPLEDILRVDKELYKDVDFFICNNGTYYYDLKTKESTFDDLVPNDIAKEFLSLGINQDCYIALYTDQKVLRTNLGFTNKKLEKEIYQQEWKYYPLVEKSIIEKELEKGKITQSSLLTSKENAIKLFNIFSPKYSSKVKLLIAGGVYLDINPLNASKWEGIKKVAKKINVSLNNIITFGDSGNDVEMLENAKLSFCMSNGTKAAKKAAKTIIGSNLTDAIGLAVEKILRKEND